MEGKHTRPSRSLCECHAYVQMYYERDRKVSPLTMRVTFIFPSDSDETSTKHFSQKRLPRLLPGVYCPEEEWKQSRHPSTLTSKPFLPFDDNSFGSFRLVCLVCCRCLLSGGRVEAIQTFIDPDVQVFGTPPCNM